MLPVLLVTKNTAFRATTKRPRFGKPSSPRLALKQISPKSAAPKLATSAASRATNAFSSMTTKKTGGLAPVASKKLQSATRVAQILRSSTTLAKTSRTSKNTVNPTQLLMVLASWKSATRSLCNIAVMKMVVFQSSKRKTSTSVLVSSASRPLASILMMSSKFHL